MKKLYFFILFISLKSFSKEPLQSFILTNTGSKISIKTNYFSVDYSEKVVYYKLLNSNTESKLGFKDFEYIIIGKNKFKTCKFNNTKEINGYFVLAETPTKSLFVSSSSDDSDGVVHYVFYIIDSNNVIVDSLQFDNVKKAKSASIRGDIFTRIKFYFNDCNGLMDRISSFDNTSFENLNMDILGFFDTPVYIECR